MEEVNAEQMEMELKLAIFKRFRQQFPDGQDFEFAQQIRVKPSQIYKYKSGIAFINILEFVGKFPNLDWSYVLTGRHEKEISDYKLVEKELRALRRDFLKIANKLQILEDKLPDN